MTLERYVLTPHGGEMHVELRQTGRALLFLGMALAFCAVWQLAVVAPGKGRWTDPIGLVFAGFVVVALLALLARETVVLAPGRIRRHTRLGNGRWDRGELAAVRIRTEIASDTPPLLPHRVQILDPNGRTLVHFDFQERTNAERLAEIIAGRVGLLRA